MTTRPTDTPHWADGGSATIDEPADAKQTAGWLFQEPVPFGWVNWAWSRFSLWAAHFASVASRFSGPDAAIAAPAAAPFSVGDSCIIGDYDDTPGFSTGSWDPGNQVMHGCFALGDVIAADNGDVEFYARDGSGLVLAITPTINMGVGCFVTNGEFTVMWDPTAAAPTNNVEIYRHSNATQSAFALGSGQLPSHAAVGPSLAFIAFDDNGALSHDIECLDLATFAQQWVFDHSGGGAGNGVADLVQWGPFLFLIGTVSSHASGATMRCIEATTGRDLTGEGGVGTSPALGERLWDEVASPQAPNSIGGKRRILRCDGKILAFANTASDVVEVRNPGNGEIEKVLSFAGTEELFSVEIDHAFVYADVEIPGAPDRGFTYCFGRGEWSYQWRYPEASPGTSAPVASSDGFALFLENRSAGSPTPIVANAFGQRIATLVDPNTVAFRDGNGHPFNRKVI